MYTVIIECVQVSSLDWIDKKKIYKKLLEQMVISKELPKCIHMEHVIMTWEKRFFFSLLQKSFW